uniref:Venom s1 protease with cub domain 5 n=1 Tax=Pristhesancus plagipennis TaxID=1955184 RepID=A0A1Q1NPK5_PRIPG|nr:venom s1 protease with cub domain 5 [Pristhesancus plagipennis]
MKPYLLLALVVLISASEPPIRKAANLKVSKGQEVPIESPGYPNIPPAGTRLTWHIVGDVGTNLLVICDDLRISPSPNCEKGYFMVNDGLHEEKYCGSESGLTARSISNLMTLEFDVNWSSGLAQCVVKGVESDEGTVKPKPDNDGNNVIKLEPGKPGYDKIFDNYLNRNMDKVWSFETTPGSRIALDCTELRLANNCNEGKLEITDGNAKEEICGVKYEYKKMSVGNTLKIHLKTALWYGGRMNCFVQAVTGVNFFQYRNIISREVDSSEYGRMPGPKKTDCKCGWSAKSPGRIVNGQEVSDGQYPWVVSLNYYGGHICGGSIITEYHILTAAHCTVGKETQHFKIYTGTTNNTHANRGQIIQVRQIINHNYNRNDFHANDIAIMLLEEKIQFTDRIGPVCLTPNRVPLDHLFITVMGWGALGAEGGWLNPEQLMRAHMRVVDYDACSYLWYRKFDTSAPDRVCTWASNRDSCFGDSGGPLVWLDPETNRFTQIGLVSFGRGCNTDYPKVNSNVAHFYDWIQSTVAHTHPGTKTCKKI